MIAGTAAFARYWEGVRERTLRFIDPIPPEAMDFSPHPGKYTMGDLIRHIASTELMFVNAALDGRWGYRGHHRSLGATKEEALAYLMAAHSTVMARLNSAPDALLGEKRPTLDGHPVSAWRLLMLMVEHEVHHRSQISQYLVDLGVQPPQIFGKAMEELPPA
ncbi:MAG: DinB family protein [Bacillota bacterium]